MIFRHETVGFGIEPNSAASRDLQQIATARRGEYHHAADATQLGDLFTEFVNTFTLIDMLGTFGGRTDTNSANLPAQPTAQQRPSSAQSRGGQMTGSDRPVPAQPKSRTARTGAVVCELVGGAGDRRQSGAFLGMGQWTTLPARQQRSVRFPNAEMDSCQIVMTFTTSVALSPETRLRAAPSMAGRRALMPARPEAPRWTIAGQEVELRASFVSLAVRLVLEPS